MGALGDAFDASVESASGNLWSVERLPRSATATGGALRDPLHPAQDGPGIAVVFGTLAPQGAVIKRAAATARLLNHEGPAVVFDGVEDLNARINDDVTYIDANSVLVLRGAGPIGGPGMPEVGHLPIPTRLLNAGVTDMVRISDARMSGTAVGTVVLHVSPESAAGGPLRLVQDGDLIRLDVDAGVLDLLVPDEELQGRAAGLQPNPRPPRGYAQLYASHVLQAPQGCDFDFLRDELLHRPSGKPARS
jgi:dihydroxy-acid dehydratase